MECSQIHFYVMHIGSNPPLQGFGDIRKSEHAFKSGALSFKFKNTEVHSAVQIFPDKNVLHKRRPLLQGYDSTVSIDVQFCSPSEIFGSTGDWTG